MSTASDYLCLKMFCGTVSCKHLKKRTVMFTTQSSKNIKKNSAIFRVVSYFMFIFFCSWKSQFASLRHCVCFTPSFSVPLCSYRINKISSQDMPGHINLFIFHCLFVPFLFQEFSVKFVKNHIRQNLWANVADVWSKLEKI